MGEEAQPEFLLFEIGAGRSARSERALLIFRTLIGPGLRARRCARFFPVNALPIGARVRARNNVERGIEREWGTEWKRGRARNASPSIDK